MRETETETFKTCFNDMTKALINLFSCPTYYIMTFIWLIFVAILYFNTPEIDEAFYRDLYINFLVYTICWYFYHLGLVVGTRRKQDD